MNKDFTQILIATKNAGKIRELENLLAPLRIKLHGLNEFENICEPEETGATFAENAALKAVYYARTTKLASLADDSGLEVAVLDNAPGIFSARYAGENASDADKISKLLNEMKNIDDDKRAARFVCAMALTNNDGKVIFQAEGICRGKIAIAECGENGFGYDPVFIPEGFDKTFGELSGDIKSNLSHRAQAIGKIIRFLRD